jgi:hypothetical protein
MSEGQYDIELLPCLNTEYRVTIRAYALGQHRIQLCKGSEYNIVREACTYKGDVASHLTIELIKAKDPEALMESLAKPWNCEAKGGRIRLDNVEGDR